MSRKYNPEVGGAENFPSVSDPKADTSSKDIFAGDRHAKEQHDRVKEVGYTGWALMTSRLRRITTKWNERTSAVHVENRKRERGWAVAIQPATPPRLSGQCCADGPESRANSKSSCSVLVRVLVCCSFSCGEKSARTTALQPTPLRPLESGSRYPCFSSSAPNRVSLGGYSFK